MKKFFWIYYMTTGKNRELEKFCSGRDNWYLTVLNWNHIEIALISLGEISIFSFCKIITAVVVIHVIHTAKLGNLLQTIIRPEHLFTHKQSPLHSFICISSCRNIVFRDFCGRFYSFLVGKRKKKVSNGQAWSKNWCSRKYILVEKIIIYHLIR